MKAGFFAVIFLSFPWSHLFKNGVRELRAEGAKEGEGETRGKGGYFINGLPLKGLCGVRGSNG